MPAAGIRAAGITCRRHLRRGRGGSLQQRAKRWTAPAADVWLNVPQGVQEGQQLLADRVPGTRRRGRSRWLPPVRAAGRVRAWP